MERLPATGAADRLTRRRSQWESDSADHEERQQVLGLGISKGRSEGEYWFSQRGRKSTRPVLHGRIDGRFARAGVGSSVVLRVEEAERWRNRPSRRGGRPPRPGVVHRGDHQGQCRVGQARRGRLGGGGEVNPDDDDGP